MTVEKPKEKFGHLNPATSALFICDIQEKFEKSIELFEMVVTNVERMVQVANILKIPTVTTEQYPQGLGLTVSKIRRHLQSDPISKTQFSMVTNEVKQWLNTNDYINTIILGGIETHVCIQGTAIDLLHMGYNVHILVDATSSRSLLERQIAIQNLQNVGTHITTTESVILNLIGDKNHVHFKTVQKLIKELNQLNKGLFIAAKI